ncbi:C-terminal binding protein [Selenomonas sp. TAMA-11512]|uniref:C-terminal binding protein n=1 Tax=Selenomonas sp. TAMA-11512 TaxID=3095337 RepID=UPI003088A081|nr:C-terminal binding protein [Selenomonas sp. TAMA-11512]
MSQGKIYVTDYEYATLEPERIEVEKLGFELVPKQCRTEEDVIRECGDAVALLDQYAPITRKVMESLPNLKAVGRYGVGVNTVDLDAATELGICVLNVPDYCQDEVSNHAFALLLACSRKLTVLSDQVQSGEWDYKIGKPIFRLRGQTLGLVGFGRIPRMVAEKAKAFSLRVVAYDPYVLEADAAALGVELVSIDALLETSDLVSLHVPLTKDTQHLINEERLAKMKPTAILVNTSRGPLVDELALCRALKDGKLAGAGLDVTENEPLEKESELRGLPNVIITPHVAWYSEEAELDLKTKNARNTAEVAAGIDNPAIVNRAVREKIHLQTQG